jgi:DNA-binding transcriptional MerR regulator
LLGPTQISLFGFDEEQNAQPTVAATPAKVDERSITDTLAPSDSTVLAEETDPLSSPTHSIETDGKGADLEPESDSILTLAEEPIVVVLRDESTVQFEGPKKRGRKKREKKWTSDTPGKRGRKSLSEASAMADLIEVPTDEILFQKQYYSMGEVCDMFRMNPSHMRIWSREFESHLQLKKNKKGDRFFRPDDIKIIHLVHHLIREKKYTIHGAKTYLKQQQKGAQFFDVVQSLEKIKSFLLELKAGL